MGSHPINLAVRFLLEVAALISMGFWGWQLTDNWLKYIVAIGIPLIAAAVWGIFAVPEDPSRSGKAPVAVPGIIRLAIELVFFGFAIRTLYTLDYKILCLIMAGTVVLHYIASYDRIGWLIKK